MRQKLGLPTNDVTDAYPVPDFKVVVTDDAPPAKKGYAPPENDLAVQLAKYFESRTEIEYDVLLKQMETVPQADIMSLLGIKKKDDSEEKKDGEKDKSVEEITELTAEDQKEADELMATLAQKAKEEELKLGAANQQNQQKKQDEKKEKKRKDKHKEKKDNEKKSPVKPCSVDMGSKVSNKSPVKIITDTDSEVIVISSDEGLKRNAKIASPLNLSVAKKDESENDGTSSHGVFFSNSDDFRKVVNMSKNGDEKDECKNKEGSETDGDSSGGVYFSDTDEFKKAVNLCKKDEQKDGGSKNDGSETDSSSSRGVYFMDTDEFKKV